MKDPMTDRRAFWLVVLFAPLVIILATMVTARYQQHMNGTDRVNDSVQFWCAGNLIREGLSPYDVEGQAEISRHVGWDRDTIGDGRYDFMPFYYPYWVGMAAAPMTYLSFQNFTALWTVLQFTAAVLAAWTLCGIPGCKYRPIAFALILLFPLTRQVADMGQMVNFVLLTVAVLWWSCQRQYDLLAGVCLALLCSKPQLGMILVPCVLIWSARNSRPRIIMGCLGAIAALVGVSLWMRPEWVVECLAAPKITPLVIGDKPWMVTTLRSTLQTLGSEGWPLWTLLGAVAGPAVAYCLSVAWRKAADVREPMALSLIVVWFTAPYARSYDLIVLLFPILVLLAKMPTRYRPLVLLLFTIPPQLHQIIRWRREEFAVAGLEIWWSWIPVACMLLWLATDERLFLSLRRRLLQAPFVVTRFIGSSAAREPHDCGHYKHGS